MAAAVVVCVWGGVIVPWSPALTEAPGAGPGGTGRLRGERGRLLPRLRCGRPVSASPRRERGGGRRRGRRLPAEQEQEGRGPRGR